MSVEISTNTNVKIESFPDVGITEYVSNFNQPPIETSAHQFSYETINSFGEITFVYATGTDFVYDEHGNVIDGVIDSITFGKLNTTNNPNNTNQEFTVSNLDASVGDINNPHFWQNQLDAENTIIMQTPVVSFVPTEYGIDAGNGDDIVIDRSASVGPEVRPEQRSAFTVDLGSGDDTITLGDNNRNFYITLGEGQDTVIQGTGPNFTDEHSRRVIEDFNPLEDTIKLDGTAAEMSEYYLGIVYYGPTGQFTGTGIFTIMDGRPKAVLILKDVNPDDVELVNGMISPTQGETIHGTHGDDNLIGTSGNDVIFGKNGDDTIYGQEGDDLIYGGRDDDTISGASGDDDIKGGSGNDHLVGNSGNDEINGGEGNDHISGNSGNDVIYGMNGDDIINGGNGNDILFGGEGNDYIYGGSGNDDLIGGNGDDFLEGGTGNDFFVSGSGNDAIFTGSGKDTILFSKTYAIGDEQFNNGHDTVFDFEVGKDKILFDQGGLSFDDVMNNIHDTEAGVLIENTYHVNGETFSESILLEGITLAELDPYTDFIFAA